MIRINNLQKNFGTKKAVDIENYTIGQGDMLGLVGNNGAGKTTLIRLVCGLQEPTSGSFTLYGIKNIDKNIVKSRRRMGAVVETPSIYLDMTAEENLRQQYRVLGLPSFDAIPELSLIHI